MRSILALFAAALWLTGCASTPTPPLSAQSPASPGAREGASIPRRTSLATDPLTRQSRQQLSAARQEQETWDKYGPVSGTPEDAPKK